MLDFVKPVRASRNLGSACRMQGWNSLASRPNKGRAAKVESACLPVLNPKVRYQPRSLSPTAVDRCNQNNHQRDRSQNCEQCFLSAIPIHSSPRFSVFDFSSTNNRLSSAMRACSFRRASIRLSSLVRPQPGQTNSRVLPETSDRSTGAISKGRLQ